MRTPRSFGLLASLLAVGLSAQVPGLPSEMPSEFKVASESWDHTRREEMIPMRDGVKLRTIILVPKGAKAAPILLTRTPYHAAELTGHAHSSHLGPVLQGYDNVTDLIVEGGYIRVVQDIRGKHGSEGDYVMNRPLRGPLNPTAVDHSTDTFDTIDWLVKHLPESNGRVGILGISYDGFLPLMALVNPHPALKAAVPMNPMVDGWRGDDWFHHGAFRAQNLAYIYDQQATRTSGVKWWTSHFDDYDLFLQAGSTGALAKSRGMEQLGFWRKILEHPGYDKGLTWPQWLTDDQREASGRTDVLAFVSEPLAAPLKISGEPVAHLVASTSGTDADWVVKVIDVYPDEVASQPGLGGFQLMVSADIFRGRYRESLETPKALTSDAPLTYRFALPSANHVFLPGHRVMVQIQSSWFPLYDRNPQTFVPSIFFAQPEAYRPATQRIYHAPGQASFVELPVVK